MSDENSARLGNRLEDAVQKRCMLQRLLHKSARKHWRPTKDIWQAFYKLMIHLIAVKRRHKNVRLLPTRKKQLLF